MWDVFSKKLFGIMLIGKGKIFWLVNKINYVYVFFWKVDLVFKIKI